MMGCGASTPVVVGIDGTHVGSTDRKYALIVQPCHDSDASTGTVISLTPNTDVVEPTCKQVTQLSETSPNSGLPGREIDVLSVQKSSYTVAHCSNRTLNLGCAASAASLQPDTPNALAILEVGSSHLDSPHPSRLFPSATSLPASPEASLWITSPRLSTAIRSTWCRALPKPRQSQPCTRAPTASVWRSAYTGE